MQHALAAIRSGRVQTRFVSPGSRQRRPRLGLGGRTYHPVAPRPAALHRPIDALRAAARGHVIAPAMRREVGRRADHRLSWSRQFQTGLRRARPRSAAPWRG